MYCPRCSQEQVSEFTRFCSRCGFLMTGVSELLANNGNLPQSAAQNNIEKPSPRKKGLKQGGIMLILGTFIVPLLGVSGAPEAFIGAMSIIFFLGGVLRIIYAALFQSNLPQESAFKKRVVETAERILPNKANEKQISGEQSIPAADYLPANTGSWRDTNDLTPPSVTDNTTKLLDRK